MPLICTYSPDQFSFVPPCKFLFEKSLDVYDLLILFVYILSIKNSKKIIALELFYNDHSVSFIQTATTKIMAHMEKKGQKLNTTTCATPAFATP